MTTKNRVALPYMYVAEFDRGRAVASGQLFFGVVDQDPEVSPTTVYILMENGDEVPIAQPVLTSPGGVPIYNGSPAILLISGKYSMRVRDSLGAEIYYAADADAGLGDTAGIAVAGGNIVSDGVGAQSVVNCFGVTGCTISGEGFRITLASSVIIDDMIIGATPQGQIIQLSTAYDKIDSTTFDIFLTDSSDTNYTADTYAFNFTVHDAGR